MERTPRNGTSMVTPRLLSLFNMSPNLSIWLTTKQDPLSTKSEFGLPPTDGGNNSDSWDIISSISITERELMLLEAKIEKDNKFRLNAKGTSAVKSGRLSTLIQLVLEFKPTGHSISSQR